MRLPGNARFFRRHPVLVLLEPAPGIPEYLYGAPSVGYVVLFYGGTFASLLFPGLNPGLYGPRVLLVRGAWGR